MRSSAATDTGRTRLRGVRSSWLLSLVAVVPLAGVLWATWARVDAADELRGEVRRTEQTAERAAELMRLDAALFDEMIWRVVHEIGAEVGVAPSAMTSVFGSNPDDELRAAIAKTDALAVAMGDGDLATDVAGVRGADLDLGGVLAAYGALSGGVRAGLDGALTELADVRDTRAAATELRAAVDLLDAGIGLRVAVADGYYEYFAVVFDIRDAPAVELARLVETRAAYRASLDELSAAAQRETELGPELDAVLDDPALIAFAPAIDRLIERSMTDGVGVKGDELSIGAIVADLAGLTATYRAAGESKNSTLRLLDRAAGDVIDAARRLAAEAQEEAYRSYAVAIGLSLATLVAVTLVAGFFVGPLGRLSRAVDQLHTGDLDDADVVIGGPVEVKAAAVALRETALHFSLVTSQAQALAEGDLTADILDRRIDGRLGDALQTAVARLRAALTQQEEFRLQLSHDASHDGLTQIANRNASVAHLDQALARTKRSGTNLAALFIDLDHFKDVNDRYGHQAGDAVLTTVARRLVEHTREGDFVGRLGGDEFMVVVEPVRDVGEAVALSRRLLDALARPVELPNGSTIVSASIGVALADATHLTADELLRDADLAVYRAKGAGRGGIEICDEGLRRQVAESVDLTHAIARAVAEDEFVLHYQPVVASSDHRVIGYEALVRWQRADTGEVVAPGRFMEFAERSELIVDVDRWVIDAAARQLADWRSDPRFSGVPVSVNISGRHLLHDDVVAHVLDPIERHGVDPRLVIVELTESALQDDLAAVAVKLRCLREVGVRVAIDDFGTGSTSFAVLRSLPVDIWKIDRAIAGRAAGSAGDLALVQLMVDAGHLLGVTVTAEGVESAGEAVCLADVGTDHLQGSYFAQPCPAESLAAHARAPFDEVWSRS